MDYHETRSAVDTNLVPSAELSDADNSGSCAEAELYDRAVSHQKRSPGAPRLEYEPLRYVPGQIYHSASASVVALSQQLLQSRSVLSQKRDASPFRRSAIVETLLGAAFLIPSGGNTFLRSLWAEEAMNRAENMLELVQLLEKLSWTRTDSPLTLCLEAALAEQIATIFRSLNVEPEEPSKLCTNTLEGIVIGLTELFNPNGNEVIITEFAMLSLPASKRRAFVLAVVELVCQILLHQLRHQRHAQIHITLERRVGRKAFFRMEDTGRCIEANLPTTSVSIVARLVRLLETEILYRRSHLGGTAIEFLFPI
jgi:hypothetical protein